MMARLLTPERFSFLPHDEAYLMIIETFTTTALVLLLGELLPKMLFRYQCRSNVVVLCLPHKVFGIHAIATAQRFISYPFA